MENFERWGFAQGQGALIGALAGEQPIANAVADVIGGKDPARGRQGHAGDRRRDPVGARVGGGMAARPRGPPQRADRARARAGHPRAARLARRRGARLADRLVVLVMVVLPVLWALVLSFQRIRLSGIRRLDLLGGEYTLRNYDLLLGVLGLPARGQDDAALLRLRDRGRDRPRADRRAARALARSAAAGSCAA